MKTPIAMQKTYIAKDTNTANLGSVFMFSSLAIQVIGLWAVPFCSACQKYGRANFYTVTDYSSIACMPDMDEWPSTLSDKEKANSKAGPM
jgi:hypothetical protein